MKYFILVLAFALACIGCESTISCGTNRPPRSALSQALAGGEAVAFRSHNGKAYRRDNDTELIFYRNYDAMLLDWGIAGEAFRGRYHLHSDGCVTLWFKDYRSEWPAMRFERDGDAFVLRPIHPPNGLTPFDPTATTQPAERNYWQFRQLDSEQTAEVLRTANQWLGE